MLVFTLECCLNQRSFKINLLIFFYLILLRPVSLSLSININTHTHTYSRSRTHIRTHIETLLRCMWCPCPADVAVFEAKHRHTHARTYTHARTHTHAVLKLWHNVWKQTTQNLDRVRNFIKMFDSQLFVSVWTSRMSEVEMVTLETTSIYLIARVKKSFSKSVVFKRVFIHSPLPRTFSALRCIFEGHILVRLINVRS